MSGGGSVGMKQPAFDELVTQYRKACGQIESLSHALWSELTRADLSAAPAMKLNHLAAQMRPEAQNLLHRQGILHKLEQQHIDVPLCTPQGEIWHVPDDLKSLQARLDGLTAADLAQRAANGDRGALAQLKKYGSEAKDPAFAKALLERLGAKSVTELPAAIATRLRGDLDHGEAGRARGLSQDGKAVLRLLSSALATGTDPKSSGYVGDAYLQQLKTQGRASFDMNGVHFYGYQSMAMLWRTDQGSPNFSAQFMHTVGTDAIAFEHDLYKDRWDAAKGPLGRRLSHAQQVSMPDLASQLGLGDLLKPGQPEAAPTGKQDPDTVVGDLLTAAGGSKDASQALLGFQPQGWHGQSILTYLLTTRLGAFQAAHDYGGLSSAIRAGLGAHDKESAKLTGQALTALKPQIAACYGRDGDGKLKVVDSDRLKQLGFLRNPLGHAIAGHIGTVSDTYEGTGGFPGLGKGDLSRSLVFVTGDDQAFNELVQAESQRMWGRIKDCDYQQIGQFTPPEARMFGFLVEARRLSLYSQSADDAATRAQLKSSVEEAIGLLGSPGSTLGTKVAGRLGGVAGGKLEGLAYGKVADWMVNRMLQPGLSMDQALTSSQDGRDNVTNLMNKMIISAKIAHAHWSTADLAKMKGHSFATDGHPPQIKPLDSLNPKQFNALIEWARSTSDIETTRDAANRELNGAADDEFHNDLGIDHY